MFPSLPAIIDRKSKKCFIYHAKPNKKLKEKTDAHRDQLLSKLSDKARAHVEAELASHRFRLHWLEDASIVEGLERTVNANEAKKAERIEKLKALKKARPAKEARPANLTKHIADIAKEVKLEPRIARQLMRKSKFVKSNYGWWFSEAEAKLVASYLTRTPAKAPAKKKAPAKAKAPAKKKAKKK